VITGRDSRFRGTQGTSICQIFEAAIAQTGASEKQLTQLGETDLRRSTLPQFACGVLPGRQIHSDESALPQIRREAARRTGARRGRYCQAHRFLCHGDPDGLYDYDLEEAELSYAPHSEARKTRSTSAGMVAADILRGDMPLSHWSSVDSKFILDVRNPQSLPWSPFWARSISR